MDAPALRGARGNGRRDVLEGRLIWVAHEVLRSGSDVILDLGCWSRDERWALRVVAAHAEALTQLVCFAVPEDVRRQRAADRHEADPGHEFSFEPGDHDLALQWWQPPTPEELSPATLPPDPPAGWSSWSAWAAARWPGLPVLDARS